MFEWFSPKTSPNSNPKEARINIKGSNPKVWENPWYPLNGPPKSKEEEEILKKAIQEEQDEIRKAMNLKFKDSAELKARMEKDARSNCADLELKWMNCLNTFTLERFLTMCDSLHGEFKQCMTIQKMNMSRLGYERAFFVDPKQLEEIIDKADELYVNQMKTK
jgi:hypothetical protein